MELIWTKVWYSQNLKLTQKNVLAGLYAFFDFQRFSPLTRVTNKKKGEWFKRDLLGNFNINNVDLVVFGHLPIPTWSKSRNSIST